MALDPLSILYLVLSGVLLLVGGLLAHVLWQLSLTLKQARNTLIPDLQAVLRKAEKNLENTDYITGSINHKLDALDPALDSASKAVASLGETTVLANRVLAQPAILRLAVLGAGVRGAWDYLRDRRKGLESKTPVAVTMEGDRQTVTK